MFVIDYLAVCARSLGERRVTHRDCVNAALSLISQIRKSFSLESDGFEYLIGHSRGAYVAIGVLGQAHISGGALLHAPFLGARYAPRASFLLQCEAAYGLLAHGTVKLGFGTFRRRFFAPSMPEETARYHFDQSRGVPGGLLLDRTQFNLGVLKSPGVIVYLYADDRAIPADITFRSIRSIIRSLSTSLNVVLMPGTHGEPVATPTPCVSHMVNQCLHP